LILKDQADVSEATTMADYAQRRQYVYDTLVAHANRTQADIRAPLDLLHVRYTPYYLVNAVEVKGGPLLRLWLSTRPEVDRILDSPVLRPLPAPIPQTEGTASAPTSPQWNLTSIGADRVWGEFGITGEGITVGQSDSGVQGDHPELKAAYRGKGSNHDYNWFDPWHHTTEPTDIGGHGTHTLGSILGENVGVAPGAEWYACANLARNLANPALYLDCMQFMLAPFPLDGDPLADGDPTRGAHVINNSWGCPDIEGCDPNALVDAVRALRAAGVFVVASAGNEGSTCGSVRDPIALYDESFSVGAVDRWGSIASFSSRGPVTADGSNRTKPDIMAPGSDVLSAYPGGPHVVGVVALMWSANPALIGDIERTEQIIIETAQPYDYAQHGPPACGENKTYPNNAVGYGLVDAYAAVERALEENNQP
jgi:subtilisin family serine protease